MYTYILDPYLQVRRGSSEEPDAEEKEVAPNPDLPNPRTFNPNPLVS